MSGADGYGWATIELIDKRPKGNMKTGGSMQNLAQIADELEDFDNLDKCKSCNAPRYVGSWTRCGTCDTKFDDPSVAVSHPESSVDPSLDEKEDDGDESVFDGLCAHVQRPSSDDADSMVGSIGQADTPSLRSHLYDSSADLFDRKKKRRARMPTGHGARSGTERLVERLDLTKPNTSTKTYLPQKRIAGSMPVLVDVNEQRTAKMKDIARVDGFGDPGSGKEVCMKEFQYLLLNAGYSEGSWKHEEGCDKECNRTCAGSCRNDGNPHTYPRSMGIFFDTNVVRTKSDFFVEGVQEKARVVARMHGTERAHASKKWNEVGANGMPTLDEKERAALILKLSGDIMHGFDDYVDLCKSCNNNPASLIPQPTSKKDGKKKRPAALMHDPGSPSLSH